MNYKAIIICGISNTGKTTSILYAADKIIECLKEKYSDVIVDGPNVYCKGSSNDRWYVITVNGKRIGIMSRGDHPDGIKHGLWLVTNEEKEKCDFYIGASHLYGDTINYYLKRKDLFAKEEIIFVNKVGFESEVDKKENEKDNEAFAESIKDLFFKMLWKV